MAPVWSPDGSKIAYVTMRKGQEGIYVRPANGQGAEELLYKNPGAFMNLSDWSSDGKTLTFAFSDMSGGTLYTLPLDGGARSESDRSLQDRSACVRAEILTRRPLPVVHRLRQGEQGRNLRAARRSRGERRPLAGLRWRLRPRRSGGATARSSITSRAIDP